jgi:prephenate dehydratase
MVADASSPPPAGTATVPAADQTDPVATPAVRIGFLGPEGTFTEEALLSEPEYAAARITPYGSLVEVLGAVERGEQDLGFVPLENAIEGTVRDIVDSLIFDVDLRIQREVVLDIHLHLMAVPGTRLSEVERVASMPMATAQCRGFLNERLPGVELLATTSTAGAARQLGEHDPVLSARPTAAIAPRLAAKLYGLDILAEDVEDHPDNQTRFVSVARSGIPAPTGHDRTSIACFQSADHPGSLYAILGHFAARNINLSKLESRPTKQALGDYCFLIDFDGHVADAVVADCLRDLHAELASVKFLGSYPAAGAAGPAIRREVKESWREARVWMDGLIGEIEGH